MPIGIRLLIDEPRSTPRAGWDLVFEEPLNSNRTIFEVSLYSSLRPSYTGLYPQNHNNAPCNEQIQTNTHHVICTAVGLQGYLAHRETHPSRTLQ